MKHLPVLFSLCLALVTGAPSVFAVSNTADTVTSKEVVISLLGKDSCSTPSEILLRDTMEEFFALFKIPRASTQTEKMLAYLQNWAETHRFSHFHDSKGNFWFDVPASRGCESFPKVILQAHMDILYSLKKSSPMDPKSFLLIPVLTGNKLSAKGTSLGADNGLGVSLALSIAKGNYKHGPLRILLTTDQELPPNDAQALTPQILDADFLINVDNVTIGDILISSAGFITSNFSKTHSLMPIQGVKTELSISGLLGGHSGIDIAKNRHSALSFLCTVFEDFNRASIKYNFESIHSGTAANTIASSAKACFFISPDKEKEVRKIVQSALEKTSLQYPQEKIDLKINTQTAESKKCLAAGDSAALIELLRSLPQGVMKMSQSIKDMVETSSNNGILKLDDGKTEIEVVSRSSDIAQLESLQQRFSALAAEKKYQYSLLGKSPAWAPNLKSKLIPLMEKAYKHAGIEPKITAIHAGVECAFFKKIKPEIQCISVGPTIINPNTEKETLFLDTVMPLGKTLLYVLEHIHQ